MQQSIIGVKCPCGKDLLITDSWVEGCRDNDDQVVTCPRCETEHEINANGQLELCN